MVLNIAFLVAIYFVPKYFYRYLTMRKIKGRYKFAVVFLSIGLIQTSSFSGYIVLPAYILLIAYFYILGTSILKILNFLNISQDVSWIVIILSQIPFYTLIGFLLGIFYEHYGTDSVKGSKRDF